MRLIFSQTDVKAQFLTQWSTKYVPAIITYGRSCSKKKIADCLTSLDELGWLNVASIIGSLIDSTPLFFILYNYADDTSKQLVALKVISEALGKGLQSLRFIYEEYSVSFYHYSL